MSTDGGAQGAVDEAGSAPVEITLEQYAGITAALADDLPLDAILDNEGLDPPDWKPVDTTWKTRLAEAGPTGPLFQSFLGKRSEAEDHLARRVRPIDDDLAAWTSFLKAFGAHPSPADLLVAQGLGLPDLARLQRRWSRRLAADQELARKAAELAAKPPAPLPPLSVEPLVLKRFPWSPGPKTRAPDPLDRPGEGASAALADLPLDRYAALRAELAEPTADPALLAPRYGLPAARFAQLDAQWKQLLAADLSLQRDYQRLFEHQRARLRRPAGGAIPAPRSEAPVIEAPRSETPWSEAPRSEAPRSEAPWSGAASLPSVVKLAPNRLAGTALALDLPRAAPLPFVEGEAPPEIRAASSEEPPAPRASSLGDTAFAVDVPRGPATPFAGVHEPPRPPNKLAGTALAVDVPRGPALPFVEGEAPEEIRSASSEEAPAPRPPGVGGTALAVDVPRGPALPFAGQNEPAKPRPALAGTALAVDVPRAPELPFAPDPAASAKAKKLGVRMFELPAHLRTAAAKAAPPGPPAAPAPAPAPPPPAIPALSIEQYASLHVELSMASGRAAEVLGRYRLSEAQRAALEAHFQGRFQREAGLRASFEQACVTYRGWLRSQGRG